MTDHNPYVRLWDARKKATVYEHQVVAEAKLGRPLEPGEVIHHDDGNKRNNDPSNVWIFSSQRAHMLYEQYRRREGAGVGHLFEIEEVLERAKLWVVR